ncbi:Na/Pi cotransporter family protein [Halarcobacter bivalviorum]|uniref:Na/Pi cotransporter family protein n=1 Tax=Halarcobacter bivalviorum TaxID=663364 RepID=UPI00100A57E6|nr:Na/Pi symporter [Halarcobacter bivalviorum]RXK06150.1 sodium:pantothenate symporter [Halarcobacter bivalviorum]
MVKKTLIISILLITAYFVISEDNIKIILSGIAIFLIGMHFMEDGFKLFSGGTLEKILEKFTSTNARALTTGFITTSIVQSSSLISVIVISFLSVELISLAKGIAIIFGANLGSTTTAWIVSSFGLNLKISIYAMPMIIFGVIFRFSKNSTYVGLGNILLGLGFIFLGISYMKEGFDTLKDSIDLAAYSVGGYLGIFIYILIGAIATVVIQSSSATMAIIITALAGANILYIDALALAIGANVGTTVTAVIGSLTSNENGKRLAFAHFVFNIFTGLLAVVLIYTLRDLVEFLSPMLGIAADNYTMKLALFHTLFNLLGIIVLYPFISKIVTLAEKLISDKYKKSSKPLYLAQANIKIPYNAMVSIQKETIRLYDNAQKAILHALSVHTSQLNTKDDIAKVVNQNSKIDTNLDDIYQKELKSLYSDIIEYALISQQNMNQEQSKYVTDLKIISNLIIKTLKDTRDIQKNVNFYLNSKNEYIKEEYRFIKEELVTFIFEVNELKKDFESDSETDELEVSTQIQVDKERLQKLDVIHNGRIDSLIKDEKITSKMATSIINDTSTAYTICTNLLNIANVMFIRDKNLRELGELDEVK